MDVVGFSHVPPGATVAEIGAGTGNFLRLFRDRAGRLIAIDLTPGMLEQARARHPDIEVVVGDGAALPLRSRSVDLVTSAQALHHMRQPVPVLQEMRRVCRVDGRILIVDQVATENVEEAAAMNELDTLRDPSHAACRPPSAFRIMIAAAGLEVEDEQIFDCQDRFSDWMAPEEFPAERIETVRRFVAERGAETGMGWEPEGDDWVCVRRRIMIRARRAR